MSDDPYAFTVTFRAEPFGKAAQTLTATVAGEPEANLLASLLGALPEVDQIVVSPVSPVLHFKAFMDRIPKP